MSTANRRLGMRFWIKLSLATITGLLATLTLFWHDWLEAFGIEPDGGNGSVEWLIVGLLFVCAVAFGTSAGLEWRRTTPTTA